MMIPNDMMTIFDLADSSKCEERIRSHGLSSELDTVIADTIKKEREKAKYKVKIKKTVKKINKTKNL